MTCNVELFLFLMYHWPFLCFLLRNICSRSLCILIFLCYWVVWVGVEYQPFKWCMIWKPFLPVCGLLLTPLIVSGTKEKHCWISFVCAFILLSFIVCAFPSFLRNLCPTSKPWSFLLLFFFLILVIVWIHTLSLKPLVTLSLFLCTRWAKGPFSLFCDWIFPFSSPVCCMGWRKHSPQCVFSASLLKITWP